MQINRIKFKESDSFISLKLNPNQPYCKLSHVVYDAEEKDNISLGEVSIEGLKIDGGLFSEIVSLEGSAVRKKLNGKFVFELNRVLSERDVQEIRFSYLPYNDVEVDLPTLILETGRGPRIGIDKPFEKFASHVRERSNTKILFSAPFGQGKTTFLDLFFDAYDLKYEVFKVFPVNYSVATNEDIFKYIKADILFQLLKHENIDTSSKPKSVLKTSSKFVVKKLDKILAPFLLLLPEIGQNMYDLYSKLDDLKEEYLEYHDGENKSLDEKAFQYFEDLFSDEGSVFEDNFFTHLIRKFTGELKEKTGRETVLIIEDLDRMDPDHIFRILNIISAHYDAPKYIEHNNKFGFDKIIVVCDIQNIKNIFHHKYGRETDFNGYMNKFFSSKPFDYNNNDTVQQFIEMLFNQVNQNQTRFVNKALIYILKSLIETKQLNLRLMYGILQNDFHSFIFHNDDYPFNRGIYIKAVAYLLVVIPEEILVQMIENLKTKNFKLNGIHYAYESRFLIAGLGNNNSQFDFTFNGNSYKVLRDEDYNGYMFAKDVKIKNDKLPITAQEDAIFTNIDFYDLLILTIKRYNNSLN